LFFSLYLDKEDNRGKQRLGFNKVAVKQPKPYGEGGRGIDVKDADSYNADVDDKLNAMFNRNRHAKKEDASAKVKHVCGRCNQDITEDEIWVTAMNRQWHKDHFTCIDCNTILKTKGSKYFDKNGEPQCAKCERDGKDNCAGCKKAFGNEEASVKALDQRWHTECFFCAGCGSKFALAKSPEGKKFREKSGRPYCLDCYGK